MNQVFRDKVTRVLMRKAGAFVGKLYPLQRTLDAIALRPFDLRLELTNVCNANCIFCPYQFQTRPYQFMSDEVFHKSINDYHAIGGGSIGLTPIVGDALIHPKFVEWVRYLRSLPHIDRIYVTTNAILLDKHGIEAVLDSGLTAITISTAGFDEESYKRIYRSNAYQRVKQNVTRLVELNAQRKEPIPIFIGLRSDRPLDEVMKDPDFQPILAHKPGIDFTWSFTTANGRITREMLPSRMKLRVLTLHKEPCVQLFNGPMVIPDGTVIACNCVAAMDAMEDLGIGNILENTLLNLWTGAKMKELRAGFTNGKLNKTCAGCDMYHDLELYRTFEGRKRARLNIARLNGEIIRRPEKFTEPFAGG